MPAKYSPSLVGGLREDRLGGIGVRAGGDGDGRAEPLVGGAVALVLHVQAGQASLVVRHQGERAERGVDDGVDHHRTSDAWSGFRGRSGRSVSGSLVDGVGAGRPQVLHGVGAPR